MGLPTQGGTTPNVGSGYVDPTNPDYDYGPCDTDRRHLFNMTIGVQTPDFENAVASASRRTGACSASRASSRAAGST